MEKAFTVEAFIDTWNDQIPNYHIKTPADLKKPDVVMGAVFQMLDMLGIDRDAVLAPPSEEVRTESTTYYWDLLPVINMTRVINHIVSVMPHVGRRINITDFMQPTITTSQSLLFLLLNFLRFNEERISKIEPYEEELFVKKNETKRLEEQKHQLQELLNQHAQEKGKRSEKLEKLEYDNKQIEEELAQQKETFVKERQELEAKLKANQQKETLLEQKKNHRDALVAEAGRRRALRVYDADDIQAQMEQDTQDCQEVEEKLTTLKATLKQKENSLKNLQTIKPSLDTANNLLHEITKLSESLKDFESGDLDTDSKEGELDVLKTELLELQVQFTELQTARAEVADKRQESCAKRQHEQTVEQSALSEAEENDRKSRERCKKAVHKIEEIKEQTLKYKEDKAAGMKDVLTIKNNFMNELEHIEETLINEMVKFEKILEEKLQKCI